MSFKRNRVNIGTQYDQGLADREKILVLDGERARWTTLKNDCVKGSSRTLWKAQTGGVEHAKRY